MSVLVGMFGVLIVMLVFLVILCVVVSVSGLLSVFFELVIDC